MTYSFSCREKIVEVDEHLLIGLFLSYSVGNGSFLDKIRKKLQKFGLLLNMR